MRTTFLPLAVLCGLVCQGCQVLVTDRDSAGTEATTTLGQSPPPRSAAGTMPLELLFVRCNPDDGQLNDELWNFVDEQFLDSDVRGRLIANGLRVGLVAGQLPNHLAARFSGTVAADDATGSQPLATEAVVTRRLLRLLSGRRSEIVTAASQAELVLLEHAPEGVRGATYRDASPLLAIVARPAADGQVTIEVTPEIRHGPVEKSWVGEDGMFRLETGQRRHRIDHLGFSATLPAKAMLVVGCAGSDTAAVGDRLLRDHDRGGGTGLRLLVIRPLEASTDPLFAADGLGGISSPDEPPLVVH